MTARLTPQDRMLRQITERQFQRQVEGVLSVNGWRFYHAPDNSPKVSGGGRRYVQNVVAGFPDLIAVRGGRQLAIELKREAGKTTTEQDAWLADLAKTGVECFVWRPRDMPEILRILARETAR